MVRSVFCANGLYVGLPQAVEVAICKNCDSLVIAQPELDLRRSASLESLALTAVFGLHIDPLDQVLFGHRMGCRTNLNGDNAVFD